MTPKGSGTMTMDDDNDGLNDGTKSIHTGH